MSKLLKENCWTISIYQLKKWNILWGFKSGIITWTDMWDNKSRISYTLNLFEEKKYIELAYKTRDYRNGEDWVKIKQRYPIVTSPCNYGYYRYWFKCSVFKNRVYCGRRVAKLYLGGGNKYFACRHCYELSYNSRIQGWAYSIPDIEKYEESIKKWYYRGKPTRKHKQYLKMNGSFYNDFIRRAEALNKYKNKV